MPETPSPVGSLLGRPEAVDHVPRQPDVTAWKRAARRHQHEWREARGWPAGTRPQRGPVIDQNLKIGNRLDLDFARTSDANFLSDDVAEAVRRRLATRQPHETLYEARLFSDLLSSMPMCFNLFGPLAVDRELAARVTRRWFPDLCPDGAAVNVEFEWSPGRRQKEWLDDRTAFDAVIFVESNAGRSLIGIETKYHEHPTKPPRFTTDRSTGQRVLREPKPRYLAVTTKARLFDEKDWLPLVWCHPIEQLWRDHLLVLSCEQHPNGWKPANYVLVAPQGNPAWAALAAEYLSLAPRASRTFAFRTLEDLVESAADLLPQAAHFRARYLDISVAPGSSTRPASGE
jgi:hypothetical protein